MRLVDGEQGDGQRCQLVHEAPALEPFGGNVDQAILAAGHAGDAGLDIFLAERRVDERGRDPFLDQAIDLVFHQRDQGRDNHGDPVQHHRRQLVTK